MLHLDLLKWFVIRDVLDSTNGYPWCPNFNRSKISFIISFRHLQTLNLITPTKTLHEMLMAI